MAEASPPTDSERRAAPALAALLLATAAALNPWALGLTFADDGEIGSGRARLAIYAVQALCILLGLWALRPGSAITRPGLLRGLALLGSCAALAFGVFVNARALGEQGALNADREAWTHMVASEELLGELTKRNSTLVESVRNLSLPDHAARALFAAEVELADLGTEGPASEPDALGLRARHWTVADEPSALAPDALELWRPLFDELRLVEHARFYNIKGHFLDDTRQEYEIESGFGGMARTKAGKSLALKGRQTITWRQHGSDAEPNWLIVAWRQTNLSATERSAPMFEEVLDRALPDAEAREIARYSLLEERWGVVAALEGDPFDHPNELFELFGGTSPSLTAVDVDRDGFDDLFMVGDEPSLFLRGLPDGRFEDATDALGLDFEEATSATFADLDNDGVPELFLGRNYEPSSLLVLEDGRYVDRSERFVDGPMPQLVSAVAAADYDNDGLLDLYVSTYGFSPLGYERQFPELRHGDYLLQKYLPLDDAIELNDHIQDPATNWVINAPGPPNVLMHNEGGGRLASVDSPGARVFKNTFQATWSDFDEDGDQDLYVANDFSPNNLLRNDGADAFADIAGPSGTEDIGFGMGVTWGDYDQDGRHDLYVANMYSKAGKRVLAQFGQVDERLKLMYRGNSLFHNEGERFEKTSGMKAPKLLVEAAGWSWGSQFVDLDNDGWLDIYALSGMITAPKKYEIPVDI